MAQRFRSWGLTFPFFKKKKTLKKKNSQKKNYKISSIGVTVIEYDNCMKLKLIKL